MKTPGVIELYDAIWKRFNYLEKNMEDHFRWHPLQVTIARFIDVIGEN